MNLTEKRYKRLRDEMVETQIIARGISDPSVISALRTVPRHRFVLEAMMDQAYMDYPLPIGEQQTISQPFIVAEMTQALSLHPEDRVLEIGTGSGYQAAILAHIVAKVYTIERKHSLFVRTRRLFDQLKYYNIVTRYTDGTAGWKEEAPFDAIIVTAGAPDIPPALLDQLTVGGRLVIPVGDQHSQDLVRVVRGEDGYYRESLGRCRFVKLIGEDGWKED
jgi:protein-L-isoaspartate(D-aspartate) O-methyltransferase